MNTQELRIGTIPAVLWGEPSEQVFIAVHGNMSNKRDRPIEILAEEATARGYQVLSFDLPQHGERLNEAAVCKVQNCVEELAAVLEFARQRYAQISLFGCSMGAYFALLAYRDATLQQSLLLSPIVDMERLIGNMLRWNAISEERLEAEREIATPNGPPLYWDYYCYVKQHPLTKWAGPTAILYGSADALCERAAIDAFIERFGCKLTVLEQSEHFFHTPQQLDFFRTWLREGIR